MKMADRGSSSAHRSEFFLTLHLRGDLEALSVVRAMLQRAAEVLHFPEAEARAIVRSVDEALTNVIRHAYEGREGLPIELTCRRLWTDGEPAVPYGVEIVIEDSGVAANPQKLRSRPLDEIRPGGLGIHFMKQSMDIVEFSRENDKNVLRMVKYLAPSKPDEGLGG
jgi:serine/threonine-protein kinase RsbW